MRLLSCFFALLAALGITDRITAGETLQPMDLFELEYASSPAFSPDGSQIAYLRHYMDVMKDTRRANLWLIHEDGTGNRPLTVGARNDSAPQWAPDGSRIYFVSSNNGEKPQLFAYWTDTHQITPLTRLTRSPFGLSVSPDGQWIALSMSVPTPKKPLAQMPTKPKGADWAAPPIQIETMPYRIDGAGFIPDTRNHLFLVSTEGGTPRRLTSGDFNYGSNPVWSPDSKSLYFSANLNENREEKPANSEIYRLTVADSSIEALTERDGPDYGIALSPNGKQIAYVGYDDKRQAYQVPQIYVMNSDGSDKRAVAPAIDREVGQLHWTADGKGLVLSYSDWGNGKVVHVSLKKGKVTRLADNLGGSSVGRPYGGGDLTLHKSGRYAYTMATPHIFGDLAVGNVGGDEVKRITSLNADLFGQRELAEVEEIRYKSSFDGREIQGWIAKPPGFDPSKKYPLLLEIHGGPHSDYGDRFAMEIQLFAAAGYVVLYTNPRGSSSYGQEFGNLIHHRYPCEDYDDLISGVDAVIAKGYIHPDRLFVTGGSGGGLLTAWIVGKTDRFRAAVSAKPVINWYSFVLHADLSRYFVDYWFPGPPWEHAEHYMKRSPLSLVGNVTTPTMLLTGENDYRTPISESEQYYAALKLRGIDTAMMRIPGASHGIANRPSQLIAKVNYILGWFKKYDVVAANKEVDRTE